MYKANTFSSFGQCRKLRSANLLHTDVTSAGVLVFLNTYHSSLVDLRFEEVAIVVYQALLDYPDRKFSLKALYRMNANISDDQLTAVVKACPKVLSASRFVNNDGIPSIKLDKLYVHIGSDVLFDGVS